MAPRSAMVTAGCTAPTNKLPDRSGISNVGRPVGTSPMTGTSVSHKTPISVPATNAAKAGGRYFLN